MRSTVISLAVAFALASICNLYAAELAGVSMPDTVQVGRTSLVLNGMGLRTKYMVKVYVAGLYLTQKSADPGAILKADEPKRIVLQFMRSVSKNQMAEAFDESFRDNAPDAERTMKADIDRMLGAGIRGLLRQVESCNVNLNHVFRAQSHAIEHQRRSPHLYRIRHGHARQFGSV